MEQNQNKIDIKPFYKKVWHSITKFEKYPEMAAEGVGRAIGYFCLLIFIFSIFIAIALTIQIRQTAKKGINLLDESFTEINYQNGILTVKPETTANSEFGNVIINTGELTSEQINQYENSTSNNLEFIWLSDRVIAKFASNTMTYYYKDILGGFQIQQFDKTALINTLKGVINAPQLNIAMIIIIIGYAFLAYFLSTLLDVLILSAFGMITTLIAKIKIRYRAIFNMSVYAITLSTFLRLIYLYIGIFTDFTIKHFELMYTAISFICLAAAIFMIKSDMIRQQMEIMKMIQIKKENGEQQVEEQEEKKEEEKQEEPEKPEEPEKKEKEEKKEGKIDGDTQGSNA